MPTTTVPAGGGTVTTAPNEGALPYWAQIMQLGEQAYTADYSPYTGPRFAEPSNIQLWAEDQYINGNMTASPYIDYAGAGYSDVYDQYGGMVGQSYGTAVPTSGTYGTAVPTSSWTGDAATSQSWGKYDPLAGTSGIASLGKYDPKVWGQYDGTNRSFTDAGVMSAYMNPYFEGPMAIQMREAERTAAMKKEADRAAAAARGSFGGSRSAIIESEADRNTNQLLADIATKASNEAYNTGREQFNTEELARFNWYKNNADIFGRDADRLYENEKFYREELGKDRDRALTAYKYGSDAFAADQNRALETWQKNVNLYNDEANRSLNAWKAGAGQFNAEADRDLDAWQKGATQYNSDADRTMRALSGQGSTAQGLASLATTDFNQNQTVLDRILKIGQEETDRDQRQKDWDYANFQAQRDRPELMVSKLAELYQKMNPGSTTSAEGIPPNVLEQLSGLLGVLLSQQTQPKPA